MQTKPFFSIVIPTYNRVGKIEKAVQSVLNQSFPNFELLVIDDGSTDNTREVITAFNDPRIRYIYQTNQERSAARNNGIRQATADFICFLDSDDTYLPNHLEALHAFIPTAPDPVALFSTGLLRIDERGIASGHPMLYADKIHPLQFVWKYFLFANTVCAHRRVFENHLFDERFRIWEDTHLWIRLLSLFPFYQIPVYTVIQQQHADSTVGQMFKTLKLKEIDQYVAAVDDVFDKHHTLFSKHITQRDRESYIETKYKMFYNTALTNKQYDVANYIVKARHQRSKNNLKYAYRTIKTMINQMKG